MVENFRELTQQSIQYHNEIKELYEKKKAVDTELIKIATERLKELKALCKKYPKHGEADRETRVSDSDISYYGCELDYIASITEDYVTFSASTRWHDEEYVGEITFSMQEMEQGFGELEKAWKESNRQRIITFVDEMVQKEEEAKERELYERLKAKYEPEDVERG